VQPASLLERGVDGGVDGGVDLARRRSLGVGARSSHL
jgi:hypothetical protein